MLVTLRSLSEVVVYSYGFLILIGSISNTLAFIVFSRKRFKNTVFSIYFRFMIICDTFSLILPLNKLLEINYQIYLANHSEFSCKFRYYFIYAIVPVSGWTMVFISLDRLFSISMPMKFLFRKNICFQILICLSVLMFNLIYFLPNLNSSIKERRFTNKETNETILYRYCDIRNSSLMWMNLFQQDLGPFLLMIIFTTMTLRSLFNSRKRSNIKNDLSRKKDVKFAITSVVLNVIYLALNTPFCAYRIIYEYVKNRIDPNLDSFLIAITFLFNYTNHITIFFINLSVNSLFRQELISLFKRKN